MILDKFFLKYKGGRGKGGGGSNWLPPEILPSKSPVLVGLSTESFFLTQSNNFYTNTLIIFWKQSLFLVNKYFFTRKIEEWMLKFRVSLLNLNVNFKNLEQICFMTCLTESICVSDFEYFTSAYKKRFFRLQNQNFE